ncbi:MAG TPA: hypothetical protein VFQ07_05805 [Candidatus Polarisedimenticolia bacterium]|nr:hypothetical protein [Candidatus Polarisedimenticolia bacterium]
MLTTAGHITQIVLLALFLLLLGRARRRADRDVVDAPGRGRPFAVALALLAAVALLGHLEYFTKKHLNTHEFLHYFLNTKYFAETGYSGLYEAIVVADWEDDRPSYDPASGVRSLSTYALETRASIVERAEAIKARFPPGRWRTFKHDVAWFRAEDGVLWRLGESLRDHGYNGSPLVTAILGGLASQPFLPTAVLIPIASWFDIALVLAAGILLARRVDGPTGALFVFLWAVNPFNDHAYTGGAYLRSLHLLALLAALVLFTQRRFVPSGALFSVSALLRVFPGFLLAGLLVHDLVRRERRDLLRRHAPLYASAAATALVLFAATSLLHAPEGRNPWIGFAEKMALHSQRLSPNLLGLPYLFFYDSDHNVPAIVHAREQGQMLNWGVEAGRTFASRRPFYLAAVLAFGAVCLLTLRRGAAEDGLFAGFVAIFALLHLAHYDYALLCLVPFLAPWRRRPLVAVSILGIAAAAACLFPRMAAVLDYRFFVLSALLALFFALVLAFRAHDGWRPAPAAAAPGRRRR